MQTYRRLLRYAKPYRWQLLLAFLCLSAGAALNLGSLLQIQPLVDGIFAEKDPEKVRRAMLVYPLALVGIMLLKGAFNFLGDILNNGVGNKLTADLRREVFGKLCELPLAYHHQQRGGLLLARVTNDINLVPQGICDVLGRVLGTALNVLLLVAGVFYIHWKLALYVVLVFPVAILPLMVFGRRLRRHSGEGQARMADITATLSEALAGIRVIISFNAQGREKARFGELVRDHYRSVMRQVRNSAASGPVMELIASLGIALLFYLAGHMVLEGTLTQGKFLTLLGLIASLYPQVKAANGVNLNVQNSLAASQRVFALLDEPSAVAEAARPRAVKGLKKGLRFEGVRFHYQPGHPVLRGVDLDLPAGSTLALVGPSGGGKTTLVDLVPRFHDPVEGRLTLDGVDLRQLSLKGLRDCVGVVTQDTFLFNASIADNIRYGRPGATDAEVEAAAKAAHAHAFILEQPQGYATRIGDRGVRLSGGQRQRLSIARAVLKNPPLLILDEATSALDTESERAVQAALDQLMRRRTSLVIAHRLSTVRHADRIAVIKEGRVVELGRHAELLKRRGLYARLCRLQFAAKGPA